MSTDSVCPETGEYYKKSTRCVEHDGEAGYGDVLTCQDDIKGSGDSIHEACEEDTAARVGGIV